MSSIMTNPGATVALQSLKSTNANLMKVQSEISTGYRVQNSKDNAAVWSISKIMDSDVRGFKGIQDSLNLGQATVSVARQAAESIVDRLNAIKENIVSAQTANVDRAKIQTAITAEISQIENTVKTAQLSGMNLINGSVSAAGASQPKVSFLSSLDRNSDGTVTASQIDVLAYNLGTNSGSSSAIAALDVGGSGVTTGLNQQGFLLAATAGTPSSESIDFNSNYTIAAGDTFTVTIGEKSAQYTVTAADLATAGGVASNGLSAAMTGLKNSIDALGITGLTSSIAAGVPTANPATPPKLTLEYDSGTSDATLAVSVSTFNAGSDAGKLLGLKSINVASDLGASAALSAIDGMIQTAIDVASSLGGAESRISSQADFVSKLSASLKEGIGSLIDADMEEASARLQALQVQQQLGIQALSIANQAPQALLSLFR